MDLGRSAGGLPPDDVVEDRDAILAASAEAIDRFHDPAPGAMVRIALAPTSPFSVTGELMRETAELARARGVRLHTHLAETDDEEEFCLERFGVRPLEYLESLGWLGDDVWLAHCVHLDGAEARADGRDRHRRRALPDLQRPARRRHRAGAGAARRGRARSGSASTAPPRTSAASWSTSCAPRWCSRASPTGPRRSPRATRSRWRPATARAASAARTSSGHLSAGALADVALWDLDELGFAGIADPVARSPSAPRARCTRCSSAAAPSWRTASCAPPTP